MKRLMLLLALVASGPAHAEAEKYLFPARGEDLPADTYWWLGGPHAGHPTPKDLVAVRWDGLANKWTAYTGTDNAYNASPTKEKHVVYGMPVYAPSDGVILSCWRNAPESTGNPKDKHPDYLAGRVTTTGNHVNILTPEGNVILMGHFQTDSLEPELCPIDDALMCDPNDPEPGCLDSVWLDPADRPTVRKGQLVARVGTSGNSTGPHLHLHVHDYNDGDMGVTWEYPFSKLWVQTTNSTTAADPAAWLHVSGEALNANPKLLIHPDPLQRRADLTLPGAKRRAAASHVQFLATAEVSLQNQLEVRNYRVDDDGTFNIVYAGANGTASAVDIANTGLHKEFVVGTRNALGRLKLSLYLMSTTGLLTLHESVTQDAIDARLALDGTAHLGVSRGVVTAAPLAGSNTLMLYAHRVIQTAGEATETEADDIFGLEAVGAAVGPKMGMTEYPDITTLTNARAIGEQDFFRGAVTAIIDSNNNLRLDSFEIASNLSLYTAGTLSGGAATKAYIETVRLNSDRQIVVVAMRIGTGQLKVSTYQVDADGDITPIDSSTEGPIADLTMFSADQRHVVVPVKDDLGNLEVLTWEVQDDGTIRRVGTVDAGNIENQLSGATVFANGRRFIVTALRLPDSVGRLIAWEANLR